jgi:branched-chain amino acid transport system permease protein
VIFAIIGLSLNIVLGYLGQVSLGHHAFVGIAAFVSAYYVTEKAGCSAEKCSLGAFSAGLVFAILSGGAAAGLLGLVALRIKGLYLALITLSYGFMAERSIFEIPFLTRGGAGMPAPRPEGFTTDRAFAFLCFIFLALVIFVDWRMIKSKVGRAVLSIKHSEPVAASYGINVTAYKCMAFILSGMFAGLAGGLLAFRATNVVSNDFNFANALLWVLMVVVGGLGNRTGVVIGSAFFALFPFLIELIGPLDKFVSGTLNRNPAEFTPVIGAALAILTIIRFPGGIAEQLSPITRWLGGKRFSMHPDGGHGDAHSPKKTVLSKLGLHKGEAEAATDASSEEIRNDEEPNLAGQPEEPAGVSGREDS